MLHETLKFLQEELLRYLAAKLGDTTDPPVVIGNVARAYDADSTVLPPNKIVLSLVNVEEDRVSKQQEPFVRTETGTVYKSPPLYLNLYVLIAANRSAYDNSLQMLGHVMQCFQYSNVFTPLTHPTLDARIQRLVVDLFSLNFEQVNHLWSTLGGKYLPSVLYKVRQVTVDEDAVRGTGPLITEIDVRERQKMPVS